MFWEGSSCICLHKGKLLMVLQGKQEEEKRWSIPSGGIEANETPEDCCVREVWEETGYVVKIKEKLHIKDGLSFGYHVKVHYFLAEIVSGSPTVQDPDGLIYDIRWVSLEELDQLPLSFPEDRSVLRHFLSSASRIM
ncbi:NUDIX hydrolase [Fictibacillus nanhaiensis]|uniref:NUDIX hydrolase n=1 Tax=Fictibacillus nanhaiensis TaxID=742169 RepID=UPI001C93EBFF|nr:NUDIX hydrolase [Fictibacillus nanhaiensis]MBY6038284.1 NUDIX hydrolase [Fictibacillus nanhaiensis]